MMVRMRVRMRINYDDIHTQYIQGEPPNLNTVCNKVHEHNRVILGL